MFSGEAERGRRAKGPAGEGMEQRAAIWTWVLESLVGGGVEEGCPIEPLHPPVLSPRLSESKNPLFVPAAIVTPTWGRVTVTPSSFCPGFIGFIGQESGQVFLVVKINNNMNNGLCL